MMVSSVNAAATPGTRGGTLHALPATLSERSAPASVDGIPNRQARPA